MGVSLAVGFLAGAASFLSPCVLPLAPGYLAYLAGSSRERSSIFLNACLFVLGFSLVFSALGVLLSSVWKERSISITVWLARIGGGFIILFGLSLTRVIRIGWLEQDHSIYFSHLKPSILSSLLFGAAFAVGWTPCVGPVLGAIFTLAALAPSQAFPLLLSYSLGLGLPFLLLSLGITRGRRLLSGRWLLLLQRLMGWLLVLIGALVAVNGLGGLADFSLLRWL